ncbi:MAG: RdgB/HAM1 family non-canonical purine NTP pyrophosphatase [Bifidobacteriaceae bacterium]|nr:RdgB/HAM1 family non-canonical purine NTP pyrophosphatase [Bifidobacteriaceae bacterium]
MSPRLVLATRNAHKLREVGTILGETLGPLGAVIVGADEVGGPDVAETGVTFKDNALLKARALANHSGLPAVADDSGLCVEVLGGAPGVFSARWAGVHGDDAANLELLLAQLQDVPMAHRGAWFECAAALALPGGETAVATGRLTGTLTTAPRGVGGFGYDPILVPTGGARTCAELSAEEKNAISHRGRAFRSLAPKVAAALTPTR